MHALPFVISIACAALLAPALLRALGEGGHTRLNYRDRALPFPFGVLTPPLEGTPMRTMTKRSTRAVGVATAAVDPRYLSCAG